MNKIRAEYIWMDGHSPTQKLRSKTKVLDTAVKSLDDLPLWGLMAQAPTRPMAMIVTVC